MGQLAVHVSRPLAFAMAPVLATQGARVRRRTPVLPEADGERHGVEGTGSDDPLAVLVFGESTAAGVGVDTQRDGLAPAFAAALAEHAGRPVSWRVVARTQSTAQRALKRLMPQLGDESFDLIVVALGVNDVMRMRQAKTWHRDVSAIVEGLQRHLRPGGGIVLAGLPDLTVFPSLPQPTRTVLALHARHLDRRMARAAGEAASTVHVPSPRIDQPQLYAADGFHPGAGGYKLWATHLVEPAAALLNGRA